MDEQMFLADFQGILQTSRTVSLDDVLADVAEWDSLSAMATLVYIKKHTGRSVSEEELATAKTVRDLWTLAK